MSDLSELQQKVVAFRDAREWKQFHNPKDMALSLSLEAAEVMEHFQWKNTEEMETHIANHKDELSDELVDVLYWVLLMAHDFDIDIDKQFERKMAENELSMPSIRQKASIPNTPSCKELRN